MQSEGLMAQVNLTMCGKIGWRRIFPCSSLFALLAIGWIDLVVTAILHEQGEIIELNPLMRPLLETSEWLFAAVKAVTLLALWVVLVRRFPQDPVFVRRLSFWGCILYVGLFFGVRFLAT